MPTNARSLSGGRVPPAPIPTSLTLMGEGGLKLTFLVISLTPLQHDPEVMWVCQSCEGNALVFGQNLYGRS